MQEKKTEFLLAVASGIAIVLLWLGGITLVEVDAMKAEIVQTVTLALAAISAVYTLGRSIVKAVRVWSEKK